jgi:uncharacterized protein (TIGR02328 family)
LRGLGWGRKHSTVNYVFKHPYMHLFQYHWLVMQEMVKRGYKPDPKWFVHNYRGKTLGFDDVDTSLEDFTNYPEHDDKYYQECVENLKGKGIFL